MRLHRVALTDVRGIVGTVEVHLASDGVTVIEAPNETGKSTLLDAVDVALEYKDSSKHRDVKSLWPADRDVPSTVEVELTCGAHHLVLRRTYRKQTGTELRILAPTPDTLTGDDAHDRLQELLDADVDRALFAALRFTQGRDLDAIALDGSSVLAARLDAVAGGEQGADDGGLLERVTEVYRSYFTATGQPGKDLKELEARLDEASDRHVAVTAALAALQEDADELARAERELPAVQRRRTDELEPALASADAAASRVAAAEGAVSTARAEHAAALATERTARAAVDERRRLVTEHEDLAADVAQLDEAAGPATARLAELREQELEAVAAVRTAETAVADAREARAAAQGALDLVVAREVVARLAARHERAQTIVDEAREAQRALASLRVDAAALRGIRTAAQGVREAEASLRTGAPTVTVRAHRDLRLSLDGTDVEVAAGDAEERSVGTRFALSVADVLDLEVVPGASSEALQRSVADARVALEEACRAVGCEDADQAEAVAEQRRAHQATLDRRDAALARELEGATLDELAAQLQTARDRVTAFEQGGAGTAAGDGATVDDARGVLDVAVLAERTAQDELGRARAARDAVADSLAEVRTRTEVTMSTLDDRRTRLERVAAALTAAREVVDDDQLRLAVEDAADGTSSAADRLAAAEQELAALDPELVTLERDNLRRQLEDARTRISQIEQRIAGLRASLRLRGEEGLGEQAQAATDELARIEADHRRTFARAAAAELLHRELREARDAAYRAYRAPLRERIARLARLLYGRDVELELGDDLAIVRRTLDGITLDFEQLSAGAREQLAILTGLAAAQLAGTDGVPFVLDDALGYTDQERLGRLGALLGATNDAQVIVLTCVAERFHHVGGATIVPLRELIRGQRSAGGEREHLDQRDPDRLGDRGGTLDEQLELVDV